MHKSQHPEFSLNRNDFAKDIKLLEKNYKEFIDLIKDNSLEATFADITKLTINDFDALLDWYYDSKEFNCS